MNFESIVDNDNSLYNNNIIINYFNIFHNRSNQPLLVWPKEGDNSNDSYETLNFLPIFNHQKGSSDKINPIKHRFIHFKIIKDAQLLYIYSSSRIIFYTLSFGGWESIQTLNQDQIPKLSFKSIIDYNNVSESLAIYCNIEKKLYIIRNVLDKQSLKVDSIQVDGVLEIKNPIVDIKWSNLILSIYTIDELTLLKWNSVQDIGDLGNYEIYRFDQFQGNDFVKLQWIDNESFLVSTHQSISYSSSGSGGSSNGSHDVLKFPEKSSIQISDVINNSSSSNKNNNNSNNDNDKSGIYDSRKEEDLLFIRAKSNNNSSSISSLFMVNSKNEENQNGFVVDTNNNSGSNKINITPNSESTNNNNSNNSRSSLFLLKIIDNQIKLIDSIKINSSILSPNLLVYNNKDYIAVSSSLSNRIELIELSNNKLSTNKTIELPNKCSIKSIGFLDSNGGDSINRLYALTGEKLNNKGIGLSYKPKSNYKVSLYSYNIINQITCNPPQIQAQSQVQPNNIHNNNNNNDNNNTQSNDILNFQRLILDKLITIENTLNNHTKRLESLENNIQNIKDKINI